MRLPETVFNFNDYNRDAFVRRVAEGIPDGARVLDAGAGTCKYRPLFAHCEYETQDFGQYQGKEHPYGKIDHVCDITEIPLPDGSFDWVICTEVLEHLPRPDLAVREFSRLLRPGGTLVLTAPLGSALHQEPYHFYGGFSPYWYRHFLGLNGLSILECTANGGFFKLYGQESRRFLQKLQPRSTVERMAFLPLEVVLSVWFRLLLPAACHLLDRLDNTRDFTVGFFVIAEKPQTRVPSDSAALPSENGHNPDDGAGADGAGPIVTGTHNPHASTV